MSHVDHFRRVSDLFERARSIPPDERDAFLREHCSDDLAIFNEVNRLLEHHADTWDAFDEPVVGSASWEETKTPSVGDELPLRIGNYLIRAKIGEGGMGVVYLAEQENPRRNVAVKVIRPGLIGRDVLKRFDLEASLLGRLQHSNIGQIYEAGVDDDPAGPRPFFAMEFVDGPSLGDYIQFHKPGLPEKLELFLPVVDAVQYAHQKGIIHRDLKPGNILIRVPTIMDGVDATDSDSITRPSPVILDFGVARATDSDLQATTCLTGMGQLVGTLPYMSPEQIAGRSDDIDVRSDVYALGIILYEMLVGRPPFVDDSTLETMRQVREDDPKSLSRIDRSIPADLEAVCFKCLDKEPSRRYSTALELSSDLHRFLRGEPVVARRLSTAARYWRWCRRKPLLAGMTAAVAVLLTVLAIGGGWFGWRQSNLRELAEAETRRAESEAIRAEAVTNYLVQTFRSPDPWLEGKEVTVAKALDNAIAKLDVDWPQPTVAKAALCDAFAQTLLSWGEFDRAVEQAQRAHSMRKQVSGDQHVDTLQSAVTLANALRHAGKTNDALPLVEDAYQRLNMLLGSGAPETIQAAIALAQSRVALSDIQAGIDLLETTYGQASEQLGDYDHNTRAVFSALVAARQTHGDVHSITRLLEEELSRARKQLGDHNEVVTDLEAMLAENLRQAGDLERAVELSESNLQRLRETLGEDHPNTLQGVGNLAAAYSNVGKLEESLRLMDQVTEKRREKLGPNHPLTLFAMFNQGIGLYNLARDEEALQVLQDAWQRSVSNPALGPRHFQTLHAKSALGGVLWGLQRWDEAIQVLGEARTDLRDVLGANHPITLDTSWKLGMALNGAKRHEEAADVLESARAAMIEKLGPANQQTLNCTTSLVVSYRELGQIDRALALQEQLTATEIEQLGPLHISTCQARLNFANLLQLNQQEERGEEEFRALMATREQTPDLVVFKVVFHRAEYLLAEILTKQGNFTEAEQLLLESSGGLDLLQGKYAAIDTYRQEVRERLVHLYEAWDRPQEAKQWRKPPQKP